MKRPLFILFCFILCFSLPLTAQDTSAQQSKKSRLEKEIAILDQQIQANTSKSKSASAELTLVRKKVENRRALVAESDKEIASLDARIRTKQKEISALRGRLDTLQAYSARLIRSAYKNRDVKVWYMYILASDNLSQAFRRLSYLKNLSTQMSVQARKIRETKAEIEVQTGQLVSARSEAQKLRERRAQELEELRKEEKRSDNLVAQLKREKTKYQQEVAAKRKEVEALNREIERIIRSASGNGKSSSKTEIDYTLNAEFASNKGRLPWPADGPVVEPYGQRNHPVFTNVKLPFNNGITIALSPGTQVKAVFDGVVKQIAVIPGYNKCVLVQHGQYFSMYCKMGNVSVKAGDKVKTGDSLGTVDTISGSTQLHFQIWDGTTPQNPSLWLRP